MHAPSRPLTRRRLLGLAAASIAGAGVLDLGLPLPGHAADEVAPTYSSLVSDPVFYVAHRGGGGDWPELTAYAYRHAVNVPGLRALEFSLRLTADDVLVCSHDADTARLTGVDYTIADETWSTLSGLWVNADETNDPTQPPRKFTRFEDIVETYIDDYVLFVEPKSSAAAVPLMERMVALGQPERVVWKQPINSTWFPVAKAHGFATWGYVLDQPWLLGTNLARYAGSDAVDTIGAPRSAVDGLVSTIVRAADLVGKQTIMWEIRNVADRTRALRLGCSGMMTSGVREVLSTSL